MNSLLCKSYNHLESLQRVQQVPQLTAEELAELIAAQPFSNVQIIQSVRMSSACPTSSPANSRRTSRANC